MVSNFRKGFILTFFASQELFTKIKITKFAVPMCAGEQIAFQSSTNSNYLAILAPRVEAIASMNALDMRLYYAQSGCASVSFFPHTGAKSSVDDSRHALSF